LIVPATHRELRRFSAIECRASHVVDELAFRVAVILPLQEYEQRIDLAVVAERREEPAIEFRERGVRDSRQVRSERHRGVAA